MTKKVLKKKSEKKYKVRLARDKHQTRNYLDELYVNNFKGIEDNNKPIKRLPESPINILAGNLL